MHYAFPDSVLMIFCKAPVPGRVKTRLIPELTAGQAADLHIELSVRTLKWTTGSRLCPVQLWCAPPVNHPFFTAAAEMFPIVLKEQQGMELGERMHHAFCSALSRYSSALIVGCDCPSITEIDLRSALNAINNDRSCDAVIAPAEDGGYVLIGLKRPSPELFFDMPWSTPRVLTETRNRVRKAGLRCLELDTQWDLDGPDDLRRYRKLFAADRLSCPRVFQNGSSTGLE